MTITTEVNRHSGRQTIYLLWCTALGQVKLSHVLFWLTYVPSHLSSQPVVSRDGAQAGRDHADHNGWEPGTAVQRHPEWSPHRQGGLQPSGGPVHQCGAVSWHRLCPHSHPSLSGSLFPRSLLPWTSLSNIELTPRAKHDTETLSQTLGLCRCELHWFLL